MTQDSLRTFIAIELPQNIKDELTALAARLRDPGLHATWVAVQNMHLTLRFLGDIDADGCTRLIQLLTEAYAGIPSFSLHVQGIGVFPNLRRPNVIWAGIAPLEGSLERIQSSAETAARAVGLPPETKAFKPHLTLARVKLLSSADSFQKRFDAEREFAGGEFVVSGVSLLSSKLTPNGAIHSCLHEFYFN